MGIAHLRGPYFLASSVLFTTATISWVLWDNKNQTEKRTASVRSILMSAQQQRNMEEYLEQQQLYKQHKSDTTIPSTVGS
uniref:Cytochrome c oxidase assembly protein n=1 Tax=Globodera rostochiensis TaxID=31243 RepID=A0A914I003_GLORO